MLLSQTALSPSQSEKFVTSGRLVDLGSFYDVLHYPSRSRDRKITLEFDIEYSEDSPFHGFTSPRSEPRPRMSNARLLMRFWYDEKKSLPRFDLVVASVRGKVRLEARRVKGKLLLTSIPRRWDKYVAIHHIHFIPSFHPTKEPPRKIAAAINSKSSEAFSLAYAWTMVFGAIRYVSPLRAAVPRYAVVGRITPAHPGGGGEQLLRELKSDSRPLGKRRTLLQLVNEWASDKLGIVQGLQVRHLDPNKTVLTMVAGDPAGGKEVNVASMGEGVSQLLPILTNVLGAGYDDCILVEQPEIHLHPKLQADLGDLFVEELRKGTVHQFIVETHSEHLLLRIRRRVAEGRIRPDQVGIVVVEPTKSGPRIRTVDLKPDGQFDDWPQGFFEEGYKEALALALARRR